MSEEKAIPLITFANNGKLEFNPEAKNVLKKIDGPISVIGVAGKYRTGKSYLLNQVILNKNEGFGVGGTINSCTKGIWIWNKCLKGTSPEGKIVNVIILDSEGLGAIDVDANHDSRVFTLIMLISSYFIFNSLGAIDEESLENLNMIGNLSQNVHIKTNGNDNVALEEFANYMPEFLWVLRDFSLELENKEGNKITPNQYLEGALKEQKGFTDQIEGKNKIRKFIKSFFQKRDCFTMIRPLVDENSLQKLNTLSSDQLKPQFRSQVLNLRKQIMSNAIVKKLNNQNLSGEMLSVLIDQYIHTMNSSSIPNIQNAWHYMCRNQNETILEQSFKIYLERINSTLSENWPLSKEHLKQIHSENVENSLNYFNKEIFQEFKEEYKEELLAKFQENYSWLKKKNVSDFEEIFVSKMEEIYEQFIQEKQQNHVYKNFYDFEKEVREFENELQELEPQGPNKEKILIEFISQKLIEGLYFYQNQQKVQYQNELFQLNKDKETSETKLENENQKMKTKMREIEEMNLQLNQKSKEIQEKYEMIEVSYNSLKQEKDKINQEYRQNILEQEQQTKLQCKQKQEENEKLKQQIKELQIQSQQNMSEFQREKALHEQKENLMNEKVECFKKEILSLQKQIEEIQIFSKEQKMQILQQQDQQLDMKNREIENLLKDFEEIESQKNQQEKNFQLNLKQKENEFLQMKDEMENLKSQNQILTQNLNDKNNSQKLEIEFQQLQKDIESYQSHLNKKQIKIDELSEQIKLSELNYEQEQALQQQKNQFLEQKVELLQQKLQDEKNQNMKTYQMIEEMNNYEKIDIGQQLEELKNYHQQELHQKQKQIKLQKETYEKQIKQMQFEREQQEEKNKEKEKEMNLRIQENQLIIENLRNQIQNQQIELEIFQKEKEDEREELVREYEEQVEQLVSQIDELNDQLRNEQNDRLQNHEENIQKLKDLFIIEKDTLEKKQREDKQKYQQRIQELESEYQEQIQKIVQENEEELHDMQEQFNESLQNQQTQISKQETEINILQDKNDQLDDQLQTVHQEYKQLEYKYIETKNELKEYHDLEKNQNGKKIEEILEDKLILERRLWDSQQKISNLENEIKLNSEKFGYTINSLTEEKEKIHSQNLQISSKLENLQNESSQVIQKMETQLALMQQKNQFLESQIQEISLEMITGKQKLEQIISEQKEDHLNELTTIKMNNEKEKKILKEKSEEILSNLRVNLQNRESFIIQLENKYNVLKVDFDKMQMESTKNDQNQIEKFMNLQDENKRLSEEFGVFKSQQINEQNDLKNKIFTLEMKKEELEATLEREKVLWNNKFSFQNEQKDSLINDLQQYKKNFENLLDSVQVKKQRQQEEYQRAQDFISQKIKMEYDRQLKEILEQHSDLQNQKQDEMKRMEQQIKMLSLKIMENENIFQEREIDYKNQISSLKGQIEKQIEIQRSRTPKRNLENDSFSQTFKKQIKKLQEKSTILEQELKDHHTMKSNLMIEKEQERAKYNMEKEYLNQQNIELLEKLSHLEKKNEYLIIENEKLKSDNRNKRFLNKSQTLTGKNKSFLFGKFISGREKSFVIDDSKSTYGNLNKENSNKKNLVGIKKYQFI